MLSDSGERHSQCPCCKACEDCIESNTVVAIMGTNLVMCRQTAQKQSNSFTEPTEITKDDDIVILENIRDEKFNIFDSISGTEVKDIYCPRCKYIIERAKKMLQMGKMHKNFVIGVCVHCRQKSRPQIPCYECEEIAKKFISGLNEVNDDSKRKLKTWLAKVRHLLKDVKEDTDRVDKIKKGLKGSELHTARIQGPIDRHRSEKEPKIIITSKQKTFRPEGEKGLKSKEDVKSITRTRSFDSYLQHLSSISGVKDSSAKSSKKYASNADRIMSSYIRDYDSDSARDKQYMHRTVRAESPSRPDYDSYYSPDKKYQPKSDRAVILGGRDLHYTPDQHVPKPDLIPSMRDYDFQYPTKKKHTIAKFDRISPRDARMHEYDTQYPNMQVVLKSGRQLSPGIKDYDVQYPSDDKRAPKPDRITSPGVRDYDSSFEPGKKDIANLKQKRSRDRQAYDSQYISDKKYGSEPDSSTARAVRDYDSHYRDQEYKTQKGLMSPFKSLDKLIHEEYLKQTLPELKRDEKLRETKQPKIQPKSVALTLGSSSKSHMRRSRSETSILDTRDISIPGVLKSVTGLYKGRKPKTEFIKSHEYMEHLVSSSLTRKKADRKGEGVETASPYTSAHKKFPSEEILSTPASVQSGPLLRKDFSYQFPKEIIVKKQPKRQRTSAELIKETQDMLNEREEEKKQRIEIERVKKRHDEEMKRQAREEKKRLQEEKRQEQIILKQAEQREKKIAEEEERRLKDERKREEETLKALEDKKKKEEENMSAKVDKKIKGEEKSSAQDRLTKEMEDIQKKEKAKEDKDRVREEKERVKEEKEKLKAEKESLKAEKQREKEKDEKKTVEETKRRGKEEDKEKTKPGKDDKHKENADKEADKLKKQKEKEIRDRMQKEEKRRDKEEMERLKKEKEEQLRTEKLQKQKEKENEQKNKGTADEKKKEINDAKPKSIEKKKPKDEKKREVIKTEKDIAKPETGMEILTKEIDIKKIKLRKASYDDLILRLVKLKQNEPRAKEQDDKLREELPVVAREHGKHRHRKESECMMCFDSELELDIESILMKTDEEEIKFADIIIGKKIFKYKPPLVDREENPEVMPTLFQSTYNVQSPIAVAKYTDTVSPIEIETKPTIAVPPKSQKQVDQEAPKGIIRYALSDRAYIDKGWTMLPTEKVVRKMNVYRMRPAHPEFDWFERNKKKKIMLYDTGEKLAEFDDNGRSRLYYKNGRLALDYYDAEEVNAQQRFVVFSSGELDERGRSHPITILATFDYLGNGIVFDNGGKIRLKYNQTEGVVLDRAIGPVSNWKWHTLNDPPVLQKVMIDTQMAHKDPDIYKMGGATDDKSRPDNEEMLAIEFDNFIKEKSKKLTQTFKPFQIKMKALKINEHFSLKILDQATIYLIFRDSTANVKLNLGMILDHKEIVDTDTAEVGEVSNSLERFPARTESLAGLQRSVAYAQRFERTRLEREHRLRPPEPCTSADQLTAAASRPLRPPLRSVPSASTTAVSSCKCSRKPCSSNIYYDTRLI